jgi:hypothetical protein
MVKITFHLFVFIFLTLISQLGGIAWLIAMLFRRRLLVFLAAYSVLSIAALWVAPIFGREPISCSASEPLHMQSPIYCVLNRQYVVPELKATMQDLAKEMQNEFQNTTTLLLDANFPFIAGFPLLPHLSHDDGRKVDIAFYYQNEDGYLPERTRSPIGYFAFEDGPTSCSEKLLTLRWDLVWLQRFWPNLTPEPKRMTAALKWLSGEDRIGKIFIEPHLVEKFAVHSSKIKFQGCRAARHDDHIHVQLP